jgi:SAM-dependent methyltransferase
VDWGRGRYERIAEQLIPAASVVVAAAAPRTGEHVIDIGCGNGNASVLAARRGARVTGIDPAERLLELARARARAESLDATFIAGEAAAVPLADASAEVVISAFGLIFAADASAAAAEIARVSGARARVVLSAWLPGGAISIVSRIRAQAMALATGPSEAPKPFAWHDGAALAELLGAHGFSVAVREEMLAFRAASPQQFIEAELRDHPMWIAAREVLEPRGELESLRDRALEALEEANEDRDAFCVRSSYIVAEARRDEGAGCPPAASSGT